MDRDLPSRLSAHHRMRQASVCPHDERIDGKMTVVRFERDGNLGRIVLSSPPHNFVSDEYNSDLVCAVREAGESEIRALLIEAEGPNFSRGGAAHEWPGKSYNWFRTFVTGVTASYRAIEALEVPVVAAVRGEVIGGGLELALSADFIVASENAEIGRAHV